MKTQVSAALLLICAFSAVFAHIMGGDKPDAKPESIRLMKPRLCKILKCPTYVLRLDKSDQKIESRIYTNSTVWVTTSITVELGTLSWWDKLSNKWSLYRKLWNYISGHNALKMEIDMTAPVLMKYEDIGNKQTTISMLFYVAIPKAPQPSEKDVWLYTIPAGTTFLVSSFKTWFITLPRDWDQNVDMMKDNLKESSNEMPGRFPKADPKVFYKVCYGGFWSWGYRHNEVWMEPMKTDEHKVV